jgi:Secretion system C-terminal sorting domain
VSGGDRNKINSAINKINSALANKNFIDDNNLSSFGLSFYDDIKSAVNLIDYLKSNSVVGDKILEAFGLLYEGSLIFAEMAIELAADNCAVTNCEEVLASANTELGKALKGYNKLLFVNVMNHLTNAWKFAQQAMGTKLKKETGDNELSGLPTEYGVDQNYPNPFNPTTQINYRLPEKNQVSLQIYDILGNLVSTLVDEEMDAGYHSVVWNASGLSSGVYFYTIRSGSFITTKKLVLLK